MNLVQRSVHLASTSVMVMIHACRLTLLTIFSGSVVIIAIASINLATNLVQRSVHLATTSVMIDASEKIISVHLVTTSATINAFQNNQDKFEL